MMILSEIPYVVRHILKYMGERIRRLRSASKYSCKNTVMRQGKRMVQNVTHY